MTPPVPLPFGPNCLDESGQSGCDGASSQPVGTFSVVIPTHNRKALLARAIDSVYAAREPDIEVVVVDDASSDGTHEMIKEKYRGVKYCRLPSNSGPGAARNLGIQSVTGRWAVLLDDDDLLDPGAFSMITSCLGSFDNSSSYPVAQFAHSNGSIDRPFRILEINDYFQGLITGDFVPVVNTKVFLSNRLEYPISRIGAEHLLWYHVARQFGIPTWRVCVARVTSDAPERLCSITTQLTRAAEYADMLQFTLARYAGEMRAFNPDFYRKKLLGAFTYRLLAGDRRRAFNDAASNAEIGWSIRTAMLLMLILPTSLLRHAFALYRRRELN